MSDQDSKMNEALQGLDPEKRDTLFRLLKGGAIAAPVVASFAMQGLAIRPAQAAGASTFISNSTS